MWGGGVGSAGRIPGAWPSCAPAQAPTHLNPVTIFGLGWAGLETRMRGSTCFPGKPGAQATPFKSCACFRGKYHNQSTQGIVASRIAHRQLGGTAHTGDTALPITDSNQTQECRRLSFLTRRPCFN